MSSMSTDFSPVREYFQLLDDHMYKYGMIANVYVMNPPNFLNFSQMEKFFRFEKEIEATKFSMGPSSTVLWLKDYLDFVPENPMLSNCDRIQNWLSIETNQFWASMINLDPDKESESCLKSFSFITVEIQKKHPLNKSNPHSQT